MATSSCSHWWHAPIYFSISLILAFVAITTTFRNSPNPNTTIPSVSNLSFTNASKSLRKSGFNTIATLLQISPDIFFASSSPSNLTDFTIFAIQDSALNSNTTLFSYRQLFQYHTVPQRLSMKDLFRKQSSTCLNTILPGKNLSITKIDVKRRVLEINNVEISHFNLFLEGPMSIHGISSPFPMSKSPICDFQHVGQSKNDLEWPRIIRFLSSKGYVSFSIGLHSVLGKILQDYKNLTSVTVFAPKDLTFLTSSSPLLDKTVRFHIIPQRLTYKELALFPKKSHLKTLVEDHDLQVTNNSTHGLVISEVAIVSPDIFVSEKFVIHRISMDFKMAELPSSC